MPNKTQSFRHSMYLLTVAWLVGLAAIAYFSYQSHVYFKKREYEAGQVAFDKAYSLTKEKLNSYIYGLQGMGGVYLTREFAISPREVRAYAEFRNNFTNFPGALGFGFIRYIPSNKFEQYRQEIEKKVPHFVITRLSNKSFGDYMVIESIEPLDKNRSAQGLDVGSEPNRRAAATRAMETGQAALTNQIQLVQIDHKEPGFLFYLPLYQGGVVPDTLEERKAKIRGWAYAPILASSIGNHLKENVVEGLQFTIDEMGEKAPLRIFGIMDSTQPTYSKSLEVGGVEWILKATYQEKSLPGYRWLLPLMSFMFLGGAYSVFCHYLSRQLNKGQESEKRAQTIEDQMEALVNGASFAIISVNPQGRIETVNRAAVAMLGYSQEELLRGVTPELFHDVDEIKARAQELSAELGYHVPANFEVFTAKARVSGVDVREWTYIKKDGTRFPVRLVITPIYSAEQELEGYLGIAEDITEVLSMRITIEKQQQQMVAAAKLSTLGEMAGGIAHEINNPLAIIMSKIKLLEQKIAKREIEWDSMKVELGKIDDTTLRIAKIVRGLKAFSRESGKDPKELVKISSIINDSLDLCSEKFRFYQVDLRLCDYEDTEIRCRATQISQVLVNLLGNAFDAIQNLPQKWVEIKVEKKESLLRLSVTDSGAGIPEQVAEKIMHPFFTTKEVGKGTGLGLSISKGLIEDHGGRLYLDPSSSHTRFVIELPIL